MIVDVMRQFVWRQAWHFCVLRSMQKAMQRGSNGTQSRTSQNSLQAYGYGGGARRSNNVPVAFRDMSLASGERAESFVPARSTTCPSGRPERLSRAPQSRGALIFPEVSGPGHVYRQYAVKRCLTTINCRQLRPAVLLETGGNIRRLLPTPRVCGARAENSGGDEHVAIPSRQCWQRCSTNWTLRPAEPSRSLARKSSNITRHSSYPEQHDQTHRPFDPECETCP